MKFSCRHIIAFGTCAVICLLSAGCGSSQLQVSGTLVMNGQPIKMVPDKENLLLTFVLLADGKDTDRSFSCNYTSEDGQFQVLTQEGKGIPPGLPPGQYRISVQIFPLDMTSSEAEPSPEAGAPTGMQDRLENKFAPGKSPIIRELKRSTSGLAIDLAKPN